MAANLGEVLGAPTVAALLTFMLWRDMMKASIVPAVIAAAAVWVLVPSRTAVIEAEVASLRAYFLSLFGLLKNRVLLLLILTTALRSAGEAGGFRVPAAVPEGRAGILHEGQSPSCCRRPRSRASYRSR